MSDMSTGTGKVVVNRAMSLDGFIAVPGDAQDWIFDFMANDAPGQQEAAAATGAMLVGRRTVEVGARMEAGSDRGTESRGEGYPFYGPVFVLTHQPPDPPDPGVTYLTGDIGEAVATALKAAGGKDLQILGADVAGQCLQGGWSTRSW
jgi:dihydrofolate reductase